MRRPSHATARVPWPTPALLAAGVATSLAYALPRYLEASASPAVRAGATALEHGHAFIACAGAALFAGLAASGRLWAGQHRRARLLERQASLETLRAASWQDFERLVGEAFRRWGYRIEETGQGGADGGIDLRLRKAGTLTLVQCKHWKSSSVGAPVVREMLGLMHHHRAQAIAVVTSGTFTREALRFAEAESAIELIDGRKLLRMIQAVQSCPANGR